jgi:hypothetical protein
MSHVAIEIASQEYDNPKVETPEIETPVSTETPVFTIDPQSPQPLI